jgi:sulfate transport system ATP-binding protein
MSIEIRNIDKRFGGFPALKDISLEIGSGELIALLGPSGSGKTTLLRIIAGLELPDRGTVALHGSDITDRNVRERDIGFVFQHYALFRHMTVYENVAFGLEVKPRNERLAPARIRGRVEELLKLVQIEGLAERYPSQLSGGQRQRVALARALAVEPKVLLLDEPFGALDAKVRKELRRWLRRLHDDVKVTTVFVTHDQEEALEVADRVVIMNRGRIEQVGTPEEVYDHPASPFACQFLGSVNLFHGRHPGDNACGNCINADGSGEHCAGDAAPLVAYARPHDIEVLRPDQNGRGIKAIITRLYSVGPLVYLELNRRDNGQTVEAVLTRSRSNELNLREGDLISFVPRKLRVFGDQATGPALQATGGRGTTAALVADDEIEWYL